MAFTTSNNVWYNPKNSQLYAGGVNAPAFGMYGINAKPIGGINGNAQPSPIPQRAAFTPNAFTQGQLGMGAGATPQWMMNAYTNKIQGMGGNANQPPFGVTQSGFPGMGGKTAPAQGQ
jgi:hypothetical protein